MRFGRLLLCGVGAGLLGSLAWALIAYFANYEIGWIAWIIGALAGVGVRASAKRQGGSAAAVAASLAAAICILVGKIGAVAPLAIGGAGYDVAADRETLISCFADDIAFERTRAGATIDWPGGQRPEEPETQSEYPADIWREAEARWDALSDAERVETARNPALHAVTEYVITHLADDVTVEYEERGKPLNYPAGADREFGSTGADYPADVWADALARWDAMTPQQRRHYREVVTKPTVPVVLFWLAHMLVASLSLWDVLWFGFAMVTAFRLGGSHRDPTPSEAPSISPRNPPSGG